MNKSMIIGNLTADPIVNTRKIGDQDVKVANFSVAVNEGYGEHRKTTYFRVNAWRGLAETVGQYLKKGRKVFVTGPVQSRNYIGSNGQAYNALEIRAESIEFLDSKRADTEEAPAEEAPAEAQPADEEEFPW